MLKRMEAVLRLSDINAALGATAELHERGYTVIVSSQVDAPLGKLLTPTVFLGVRGIVDASEPELFYDQMEGIVRRHGRNGEVVADGEIKPFDAAALAETDAAPQTAAEIEHVRRPSDVASATAIPSS
jgi:hypothetical protein